MAEKIIICPHSQKECIKDGTIVIVDGKPELHACPAWINIVGKHPQTGADIDQWNCSEFYWIPFLMIENTQKQRETGAEIEKLRNEIVPQGHSMSGIMAQLLSNVTTPKKINDEPKLIEIEKHEP